VISRYHLSGSLKFEEDSMDGTNAAPTTMDDEISFFVKQMQTLR
jgi:hypothetical protein